MTETFAHAPGMAQYDYAQPAGSRRQQLFGNLVGTTERMVGESGVVTQRSVYTAFGELAYQAGVGQTRYGYCGAWGYQSASGVGGYVDPLAELGWLHVGERYYDPASGRFMQRDPIGIRGGANVYEYVGNLPTAAFDPYGRDRWYIEELGHKGIIYGNDKIGYWRLDFKMAVPKDSRWWHWPKDGIDTVIRGICSVGAVAPGAITKQGAKKPNRPPDRITTPQQDAHLDEKYQPGEWGWYNLIFHNCRHQSEEWLNE